MCVRIRTPSRYNREKRVRGGIGTVRLVSRRVLGPMASFLEAFSSFTILMYPSRPAPLSVHARASGPIPCLVCSDGGRISDNMDGFYRRKTGGANGCVRGNFAVVSCFLSGWFFTLCCVVGGGGGVLTSVVGLGVYGSIFVLYLFVVVAVVDIVALFMVTFSCTMGFLVKVVARFMHGGFFE